jgi:leucyl aminopeptidase
MSAHSVQRAGVNVANLHELGVDGAVPAFCEGLALGAYAFDQYKSDQGDRRALRIGLWAKREAPRLRREVQRMVTVADAVNLARDWAHEPPNVLNPVTLGRRAMRLARDCGLKCAVYDEKQLKRMKAGAILAVGGASKTPPRLIVLEYGTGKRGGKAPVILIGKAITFDTGGYSIKDKAGIVGMKYDKCGGTTVIGVLKAAADLKLRTPIVGIIAAAENMISGEAYRPNDIVTTMKGKTVEIISTDAEGRMVLADALTFAQKHYRPRAVIDLATLTGGVVVALGSLRAGLFTNSDPLGEALIASGEHVHERLWRLPLDDDYLELIKGDDSDLKNSAGRPAHAIIGGMFLRQFVDEKTPWAHLDIAGVADSEKDLPYCPKGATGFGIRLLIDYLSRG